MSMRELCCRQHEKREKSGSIIGMSIVLSTDLRLLTHDPRAQLSGLPIKKKYIRKVVKWKQ